MRSNYSRRRTRYVARENNSFWLTFSDLMSSMLLVFILIMFYSVYQYFDMLELKTAELMRQSGLISQREAELDQLSGELNQKNDELVSSQGKLTESEQALATQQYQLMLTKQAQEEAEKSLADQRKDLDDALNLLKMKESDLDSAKKLMEMKEEDLAAARVLLDAKEEDLAAARVLLDAQSATLQNQQTTLEQQQSLMQNQQAKLDELVGVRAKIIKSLADEFKDANVKAKVDVNTGSIALDASVLFDVGQFNLKPGGKAVLDQFLPVYMGVLMRAENQSNISEIIIEGHTDSVGSYMSNLKLSQERALAVMEYMLSDENRRLNSAMKDTLRRIGTANGRSFSVPVTDANGVEDAQASRRVEFKFRMQDEQMIESMRNILDDMDQVYPSNPNN